MSEAWWREGVFYQVYPRSFADANGDGIGDLAGLTDKLDYLQWLGVTAVWLNPINPSPNVDWGYDVTDYTGVHPDLGSLADVDRLVAEAGERDIRVLLDLVPNHTSDQHPWFRERPDFYVWADEVPNNWQAIFGGGSAWELDETRGRYYLHNFAKEQPDLDWWNPEVRAEFERILRFWLERGVAGFRIDVAHGLVKDRELRDDVGERARSLHEPAGDARGLPRLAPSGRLVRAPTGAAGGGLRARHPGLGDVLRLGIGRAEPRLQLRARPRRLRRRADARRRRPHGGGAAAGCLALLDRVEPRRGPLHDSLVRRRRGSSRAARC